MIKVVILPNPNPTQKRFNGAILEKRLAEMYTTTYERLFNTLVCDEHPNHETTLTITNGTDDWDLENCCCPNFKDKIRDKIREIFPEEEG